MSISSNSELFYSNGQHESACFCQAVPDFIYEDLSVFSAVLNEIEMKEEKSSTTTEKRIFRIWGNAVASTTCPVFMGVLPSEPLTLNNPIPIIKVYDANFNNSTCKIVNNQVTVLSPNEISNSISLANFSDEGTQEAQGLAKEVYDFYINNFNSHPEKHGWSDTIDLFINVKQWVWKDRQWTLGPLNNILWDGYRVIFGGGCGQMHEERWTKNVEFTCHELTHRFIEYIYPGGFLSTDYVNEPGALNEHIADVFGIVFSHYRKKKLSPEPDDWLFGENLIKEGFRDFLAEKNYGHFKAFRCMSDPGSAYHFKVGSETRCDPQIGHMNNFYHGSKDYGGVHYNSGILNKAFYLFTKKLAIASWGTPGKLWYETITSGRITKATKFQEFVNINVDIARKGLPEEYVNKLIESWEAVGLTPKVPNH